MPRGVTLAQLVNELRAASGRTQDTAQGKNERANLVSALQRMQRQLYAEYDWPFLKIKPDVALEAGELYYDFPTGLDLEQIENVSVHWASEWRPLRRGIGLHERNAYPSDPVSATTSFTITDGDAAAATGGFTINAGTLGSGHQITQVTVNSVSLLSAAIPWGTSHTATAAAVVAAINNSTTSPDYTAANVGAAITITADPNLGATANGYVVSVTVGGDVTVTSVSDMASGANNKLTKILAGGVNILGTAIGWRSSNVATATAIAAEINATETTPAYTATAAGNEVTISADSGDGSDANARTCTVTVTGTVTASTPAAFAGGISGARVDPPDAWDVRDTGTGTAHVAQFEIWPMPATATATVRFTGKKALAPLVADTDVCTLDSDLIVMFCAIPLIKDRDNKALMQKAAAALLGRLKGRAAVGRARANLAGQQHPEQKPGRIRVAYVRNQ